MKSRWNVLPILLPLFVVFGTATALTYSTPTRIQSEASPFEWTALLAYVAALTGVAFCALFDNGTTLKKTWLTFLICSFVFGFTGFIIEYFVYFNSSNWEKEEGKGIVIGCIVMAVCGGVATSCAWPLRKYWPFRKPRWVAGSVNLKHRK